MEALRSNSSTNSLRPVAGSHKSAVPLFSDVKACPQITCVNPPIKPEVNLPNEIHLFSAQAIAALTNSQSATKTRHALLVFIRQSIGTDFDWEHAGRIIADGGWDDILIAKASKAALLPPSGDNTLRNAYLNAMENGNSMVVYAEPVDGG